MAETRNKCIHYASFRIPLAKQQYYMVKLYCVKNKFIYIYIYIYYSYTNNRVIILQIYFRLFLNIAFVALIFYTPKLIMHNGVVDIPGYYYAILVLIVSIHDVSELNNL